MTSQTNPIINLDIRCAEQGRDLSEIKSLNEKVLNEALAVLEEQGPYAMFLYVRARHGNISCDFENKCVKLLQGVFGDRVSSNGDALHVVRRLAENLDDLLFARDLLRTALGYARFYLKVKGRKP